MQQKLQRLVETSFKPCSQKFSSHALCSNRKHVLTPIVYELLFFYDNLLVCPHSDYSKVDETERGIGHS